MTILETLVAASIIGLMAATVIRPWSAEADRARVETAESEALNAYRLAQTAAVALGRPVTVTIATDSVIVTTGPADSAVLRRAPGPAALGVQLSPTRHVAVFEASGVATGTANVTHVFTRGGVQRRLILSRLGRIRVN